MRKKSLPTPYAAPTKDTRFTGTYEVLVPAEGRVRPFRLPQRFETLEQAKAWIHSREGKEAIAETITSNAK
jgi:antibiotic biosynthesis monooxygenase (ABM) superfamily enzyme